ncbi:MAG TPA: F0F1 ATP synthase subunit gamma [Gammaproteobacteria bacterium]|nr:F0F1 ATP synthase subunit gamma [Gammaproteobacteria bacterium]
MDSLEQLRRRLGVFDDLGEIVRTMKAFAAVSVRQYEQAVESLAVYSRTVELSLHVVLRTMPPPAAEPARPASTAAVVFGSDHGLCGHFNEEIAAYALRRLSGAGPAGARAHVLGVGTRAAELLADAGLVPAAQMPMPGSAAGITATVRQILLNIDAWQLEAGLPRVVLLHNRPLPGNRYEPLELQLLPVDLAALRAAGHRWDSRSLPTYTMDREQLFAALLRQHLFVTVFRACAQSLAAENAARLAAMEAAERNLRDRHEELLGEFQRRRQDTITAEILDIVSGYETLQSQDGHAAGI